MLTVAICDDDLLIRGQVETLISSVDQKIEIKRYENEKILSDLKLFDIIFMDIEIGNKSGIEFAMEVRKQNPDCIIIFFTSYTSYISDAFDAILQKMKKNTINDFIDVLESIDNDSKFILIQRTTYQDLNNPDGSFPVPTVKIILLDENLTHISMKYDNDRANKYGVYNYSNQNYYGYVSYIDSMEEVNDAITSYLNTYDMFSWASFIPD